MYKLPDFGRFPKLKDARHSYYQYVGLVLFGALALWSNMGLRHPLFADASLSVLVAALVFFTVPISHFKSCHREKLQSARCCYDNATLNINCTLDSFDQSPETLRMRQQYLLALRAAKATLERYKDLIESYDVAEARFKKLAAAHSTIVFVIVVAHADGRIPTTLPL